VAVDGKSVRGTRHAAGDGQAAHLLAAADQQSSAVLAQARVDGKTNEITQLAPLLEPLDLAGAVVTADALHTQRERPGRRGQQRGVGLLPVIDPGLLRGRRRQHRHLRHQEREHADNRDDPARRG
jgi:hypothetical protein